MTTVSLHELRMASTNVDTEEQQYSMLKNLESFELSCHGKTERGTICEYIVARQLTQIGYESEVTSQASPYDVITYNGLKIEVKSSLLGRSDHYFKMGNIKPWKFDYLFFVFVHPTEGIVVRWTTKAEANRIGRRLSENMNGYRFGFRSDMTSCQGLKMWEVEDFPYEINIKS